MQPKSGRVEGNSKFILAYVNAGKSYASAMMQLG